MESSNATELVSSDKYLFLFAHPDDDVFIAGTMKLLLDSGAEIHCVWATSGDYFGLEKKREEQLSDAMKILGVPDDHLHLLRFPDLGLVAKMDEAADAVASVLSEIKPDVIFATAFEGGHPDHDSVNFLAYESSARSGISPRLFEFPLYNGSGPFYYWWWRINRFPDGASPVRLTPLTDEAVICKHRAMKVYAATEWLYMIPARLASPSAVLKTRGELFRPCPADRDHTVRPHPGRLNYERLFNFFMKTRFEDFKQAVLRARPPRD
jgi:LmbE family N-acetylglucosaminyl deacetylase